MLAEQSMLYVGGAGSCAGCGEASVIRMWLAALGYVYGADNIGIAASTGCNTVYGSTYPYNPYIVPWSNSLFENGPAFAMGIRMRWDQQGWQDKQLWVMGGDGAMNDIGFQSLSRLLASGMNIKVLVLDTQVYSNTGGQTSTASYTGQEAKMYAYGSSHPGKEETRKELGRIAMMHPNTYVAQTVAAIPNHFYKSILEAASFDGPAVVNTFTTCQPEHGVADDMARHQAKLAVDSRAFPVFQYDPRKGDTIRDRLSLTGNPAQKEDWYTVPKTGETIDFITFARSEGRFAQAVRQGGQPLRDAAACPGRSSGQLASHAGDGRHSLEKIMDETKRGLVGKADQAPFRFIPLGFFVIYGCRLSSNTTIVNNRSSQGASKTAATSALMSG